MVKKIFVAFLLITFMTFAIALDEPSSAIGEQDAEELQEAIETYIPLDESGEVDLSKYKPVKSEAEKKIDEINLWLEENATWLKAVFGMVPSITWLFFVNLYLILLFFTILVLNAEGLFGFMDTLTKKIELGIIEPTWANILGLVIFLVLHFTKAIVGIAKILTEFGLFLWNKILPAGIVTAIIVGIIALVAFIILQKYAPQLLSTIAKKREEAKEKKAKAKTDINREALGKMVQGATQGA